MMKNNYSSYFIRANKRLFAALAIILSLTLITLYVFPNCFNRVYQKLFDPIFSILTVVIAGIIWFMQQKVYWKESLPKKLTVHFFYSGKVVMSCYEAYLSGESDIRQWGQQIGFQMTNKGMLNFYPYINSSVPKITDCAFETFEGIPVKIMSYEVFFYLRSDDFQSLPDLKDRYLIWLDNSIGTEENQAIFVEERPKKPFSIQQAISYLESKKV